MKKPLMIGGGIVAVLVVIVVVAVIVVFSSLGSIIKAAVEEIGPPMTKAEVKLADAEVSLTTGEATLGGPKIGNPAGFNTPHAFKLGNIKVQIDPTTVTNSTIVIKEVIIDAPDVIAEFKKFSFNPLKASASIQESLKTSNFVAIQKNVDAYVKAQTDGAAGGGGQGSGGSGDAKDQPKLIIEKFRMNQVKVRAVSQDGLKLDSSIPPFSVALNNIGKKEGGLEPAKIAAVLIPKVQDAVIKAITADLTKMAGDLVKNLSGALKDGAGGAVKKLTEGAGGAGDAVKKLTEGAGDSGGDAVKGAGDAVKKLFGK